MKFIALLTLTFACSAFAGRRQLSQSPRHSTLALDPDGDIVAHYRKIHLFESENNFLSPGEAIETYDSPFGTVGLIICSDVFSDFPMDTYAQADLDVIALSTSWASMNTGFAAFRAGAKWVNAYLLAANQPYFPDSGVINPDGTAQSHIRATDWRTATFRCSGQTPSQNENLRVRPKGSHSDTR